MGSIEEEAALRSFDECIFWNRLGMSFIGIWPLDSKRSKIFKILHRGVVLFFMCVILIPQWCDIYVMRNNLNAIIETLISNVFILAVVIKYYNFLKWMPLFKEIMERLRSNWINVMARSKNAESQELFLKISQDARSYYIRYAVVIGAVGSSYVVTPFVVEDVRVRKYPFFGWYYIDQSSDLAYCLFYLSQCMTGTVCAVANLATDGIFLVSIYHFCAQLRILQKDLSSLGNDASTKTKLAGLIVRHQSELRHGRALQTIFSATSSQQLLVSCLMICANGFKLIVSLDSRDFVDFSRYVLVVPLTLLGILFYCQPGDELIAQSQAIYDAIYQSAWVGMDCGTKRHLILMIQRSQRPLSITAGKVYVLSLPNFMRIIKLSMSGLSVLHAMYVKNDDATLPPADD